MNDNQTFISFLADEIIAKYGSALHETMVVFPNRRAGLFLQQMLQYKLRSSSWLPEIVAIESAFSCVLEEEGIPFRIANRRDIFRFKPLEIVNHNPVIIFPDHISQKIPLEYAL